jgi:hypothetical protein
MPSRMRRGLAVAALLTAGAVVAANGVRAAAADQPRADEYRVKAAILYNLAKFVDWPADAFSTPAAPMTVCVLGVDPFGDALDEAFRGHLVGGRSIVVRRLSDVQPGCHVVFISGSERKRLAVIADQLRAASVLTVSEEDGFGALGGMIELFTEGDRIRFNINIAALEGARLRASARLREIASNEKRAAGGRR